MDDKVLYEKIHGALLSYRMHEHLIEGTNDGMPLVDYFTPNCDKSVKRGVGELELLADHIFTEIKFNS